MLKLSIENIGDLAIIECEGKIARSESAFKLRDAVTSQNDAHTVVIELSEALFGNAIKEISARLDNCVEENTLLWPSLFTSLAVHLLDSPMQRDVPILGRLK